MDYEEDNKLRLTNNVNEIITFDIVIQILYSIVYILIRLSYQKGCILSLTQLMQEGTHRHWSDTSISERRWLQTTDDVPFVCPLSNNDMILADVGSYSVINSSKQSLFCERITSYCRCDHINSSSLLWVIISSMSKDCCGIISLISPTTLSLSMVVCRWVQVKWVPVSHW
jgi:hypothetical protein